MRLIVCVRVEKIDSLLHVSSVSEMRCGAWECTSTRSL